PLECAERHPPTQRWFVDSPAAHARVRLEQLRDVAETADELVDHAEAPRLQTQPTEILGRVAEVRELPVEHRTHTVGTDDEVPVAEIAVDERGLRRLCRRVVREPPQPELERGMRLAERVEVLAVLRDLER